MGLGVGDGDGVTCKQNRSSERENWHGRKSKITSDRTARFDGDSNDGVGLAGDGDG